MQVEYTAGPGDVQKFRFVPDDVTQSRAEMVEKRYGKNWDDFLTDVRGGNAKARKVLLWHLLRQTHHTLRFEDTPDFRMGAVTVSFDREELELIRERVMKANLSDEDREAVLTALDIDLSESMVDEEPPPADWFGQGKAETPGQEVLPTDWPGSGSGLNG